jgi:hypothetical protein
MKKVSVIYLFCILLCGHSLASGQTVSKCFRADWLQGERIVRLAIDGNKVSGTFSVGDGDAATYKFSGTLRGDTLTVVFDGNKLPDVAPSEMESLVWKLVQVRGKESLRIKFSGKNYDTNKYEESFAYFDSCQASVDGAVSSYATLAKKAQTVRFARGASSANIRLDSLAGSREGKEAAAFLINVAKSQSLEIEADGCRIEVYLPNKKLYEYVEWEGEGEKTYATSQIDRMSIKTLPVTGNYLIVLRKLTEDSAPNILTITVRN